MQNIIQPRSFLFFLLIASSIAVMAQPDHEYIKSKIVIYYYAAPNTQSASPYPRVSDRAVDSFARGLATLFGATPGMNGVQNLFASLLRAPDRGGDQHLQGFVRRILQIRDRRIALFIYNDEHNLNANALSLNSCHQSQLDAGGNVVREYYWPCAMNNNAGTGGSYSGIVYLGRHFFQLNAANAEYCKAVFMHEFFHTQDMTDPQFHKYFAGGNWFHYGTDGNHLYQEVVPSIGMAYKEGIANALTFLFDARARDWAFRLFDSNGYLLVEQNTPPVGPTTASNPAISPDVWLYDRLVASGITLSAAPPRYAGYRQLQIRSLPSRYLFYNETVIGLICSYYIELISLNRFMASVAIRNTIVNPQSDFGELVNKLCELGLAPGMTMGTFSNSSPLVDSTVENLYLLPLAFVDYFTGWRATSANELNGWLNNKIDRGLLDFYWTNFHNELRGRFPLPTSYHTGAGSTFDNMVSIAMRFGVRTSDPTR